MLPSEQALQRIWVKQPLFWGCFPVLEALQGAHGALHSGVAAGCCVIPPDGHSTIPSRDEETSAWGQKHL